MCNWTILKLLLLKEVITRVKNAFCVAPAHSNRLQTNAEKTSLLLLHMYEAKLLSKIELTFKPIWKQLSEGSFNFWLNQNVVTSNTSP